MRSGCIHWTGDTEYRQSHARGFVQQNHVSPSCPMSATFRNSDENDFIRWMEEIRDERFDDVQGSDRDYDLFNFPPRACHAIQGCLRIEGDACEYSRP